MKHLSRPVILFLLAVMAAVAALLSTYRSVPAENHECQCFRQMIMLWAASVSHALETKQSGNHTVDVNKVALYLRGGTNPECPSAHAKYTSFKMDSGPACPGNHGKAIDILAAALSDKTHPCRDYAIQLMGVEAMAAWLDSPSGALIQGMIRVISDEQSEEARRNTIKALEYVTGQKFGSDTNAWKTWWSANERSYRRRP